MQIKRWPIAVILVLVLVMFMGCGKSNKNNSTQNQSKKINEYYGLNDAVNPVDGMEFVITGVKEQGTIKGEKVEDELTGDKGYYIADLSSIVPTNDYRVIVVSVSVKNDTDRAIGLSELGWKAKLPDGYKIGTLSADTIFEGQVASHNSVTGDVKIIIDSSYNAKEFLLTYEYLDYNDEWSKALQKIMAGEMTEEEYKQEFQPIPVTWKLNI